MTCRYQTAAGVGAWLLLQFFLLSLSLFPSGPLKIPRQVWTDTHTYTYIHTQSIQRSKVGLELWLLEIYKNTFPSLFLYLVRYVNQALLLKNNINQKIMSPFFKSCKFLKNRIPRDSNKNSDNLEQSSKGTFFTHTLLLLSNFHLCLDFALLTDHKLLEESVYRFSALYSFHTCG